MGHNVKIHPLSEIIAKKLFGINSVPNKERDRMVQRACKAAIEYYDEKVRELRESKND